MDIVALLSLKSRLLLLFLQRMWHPIVLNWIGSELGVIVKDISRLFYVMSPTSHTWIKTGESGLYIDALSRVVFEFFDRCIVMTKILLILLNLF